MGQIHRVHFLGYSLIPRVGQRVSLEETAKIKRPKKLRIMKENHRNQAIPVIFGGDYWTRTFDRPFSLLFMYVFLY